MELQQIFSDSAIINLIILKLILSSGHFKLLLEHDSYNLLLQSAGFLALSTSRVIRRVLPGCPGSPPVPP
jgi:hypothetical protein